MTTEESIAEAERLLREAGWVAGMRPPWLGRYVSGVMVGGVHPSGTAYVKHLAMVPQADAAGMGLDPADYPDEPHEAAAWLIAEYPVADAPEASEGAGHEAHGEIGDPASRDNPDADAPEAVEAPDEAHGEAGVEVAGEVWPSPNDQADTVSTGRGAAESDVDSAGGAVAPSAQEAEPLDAEWAEIAALAAREAEQAEAAAPPQPETPQNRFYGLDDLDRRRALRIGDVAVIAAERIALVEAEVSEAPGEWQQVQGHVVSHLDKFTGAYTHPDTATYDRFTELSAAHTRIARIDEHRKSVTTALLAASREEVEAFDPQDGWP